MWERVPEGARQIGGELAFCPACAKLYWEGGHVRRKQAKLARWQAGEFRWGRLPPRLFGSVSVSSCR